MDDFEIVLPKILKIQLFSGFSADNENDRRILKLVYENIMIKKFKKGEVIIKEGEYGDLLYILYTGSVNVMRNTPAGDTIALANLSSDQNVFFGETALISKDTRSATVTASNDCSCIALSCKKFKELCEKEPLLGYRVLLKLAHRMA